MQSQKSKSLPGFTLVELIIVVTILGILSTIAFISFQSYSKNARDSNRLETISIVQKGISLNQVTTSKTLMPDDYTTVSASGNILGYEGIVGEGVSRGIQMSSIPKDPIRGDNYIYYTNKDRNKVQVMGFLEGENLAYIGIERANAAGSGTRIPKVSGDRLGILLDVNNNRVTGSGVDILLTNSGTSYTTYFSNTDTLTSSGKDLYSKVYNRREDLIKDTSLASLDDSLVGYWDMETLSGGKLKDFSKYHNDGTLNGGIVVGGINGIKGKATYFDGVDDYIDLSGKTFFSGYYSRTIIIIFNPDLAYNQVGVTLSIGTPSTGQAYNIRYFPDTSNIPDSQKGKLNVMGYGLDNSLSNNKFIGGFMASLYDGSKNYFYLNGSKDSTTAISYNTTGSNNFIGKSNHIGSEAFYKGNIDEIRIYNRTLSDSEIQQLYNSVK